MHLTHILYLYAYCVYLCFVLYLRLFVFCICILFCIAASTGVPRGVVSSNTHYQKALADEGLFFGGQIFFGWTKFFFGGRGQPNSWK